MKKTSKHISAIYSVHILLLLLSRTIASPNVLRQITERFKDVGSKNYSAIACMCLNGSTVERELDRTIASGILSGSLSCSGVNDVCQLLHKCDSCILHTELCQPSDDKIDFDCIRDIYMLKDGFFEMSKYKLQQDITNFSNSTLGHERFKRNTPPCKYPSNLKTADLFCKTLSTKVICYQTCIIGYTLPEGRKVVHKCKRNGNIWRPGNFQECQPYVDCTVSLKSAGVADCYTPTVRKPAMCYIKCDSYEDEKPIPRRAYTCKNGHWTRKLPFCASPGSNIELVKPPT